VIPNAAGIKQSVSNPQLRSLTEEGDESGDSDQKVAARFVVNRGKSKRRSTLLTPDKITSRIEEMMNFPSRSSSTASSAEAQAARRVVSMIDPVENEYRMWKQRPEAVSLLPSMTQNEIDRQEIIYEFITTEISYNKDLDLIQRRFVEPFRALIGSPKFTRIDFNTIFRNLESIVQVNHAFLKDLQVRSKEQTPVVNNIGDIILKHAPSLDIYSDYCGDQQRSANEMKRAEYDCLLIRNHLESVGQEKEIRKLDIYAFLLMPMQRITKYPLLLKTLLKKTPESHPDHEYIKASLAEIDRIIKSINDYTRRRDEIARITELEKQLDCSTIKTPINLSKSEQKGRRIIREGILTRLRLKNRRLAAEKSQSRKLEKLYLVLFSDMLLITKLVRSTPESPPRYLVQVRPLKYPEIAIRNVPESSNGLGAKNVFLISSQATGTIVVQANTPEEKNLWINDFRKEDLIVKSLLKLETVDMGHHKVLLDEEATQDSQKPAPQSSSSEELLPRKPTIQIPLPIRVSSELIEKAGPKTDLTKEDKKSWLIGLKRPETFLDISVQQLAEPEFDGWLKVVAKGVLQRTVWKWRYCVLKDFVLYFFLSDQPESKATSLLVLPDYSIVAQKGTNKKNVFEIQPPGKKTASTVLAADTAEYMTIWIEALTHATLSRVAPRTFWL